MTAEMRCVGDPQVRAETRNLGKKDYMAEERKPHVQPQINAQRI